MPITPSSEINKLVNLFAKDHLFCSKKTVLNVSDAKRNVIASVFVEDRYVQFYKEYTQLGINIPSLRCLVEEKGYDHNHS